MRGGGLQGEVFGGERSLRMRESLRRGVSGVHSGACSSRGVSGALGAFLSPRPVSWGGSCLRRCCSQWRRGCLGRALGFVGLEMKPIKVSLSPEKPLLHGDTLWWL